jgi:hypothetical protein
VTADDLQTIPDAHFASGFRSFTIALDVPSRHGAGRQRPGFEEAREREPSIKPQTHVTTVVRMRFQIGWHELIQGIEHRIAAVLPSGYSSRTLS